MFAYITGQEYAAAFIGFALIIGSFLGLFVLLGVFIGLFTGNAEREPSRSIERDVDDMTLYDFVQDDSDHQIGTW